MCYYIDNNLLITIDIMTFANWLSSDVETKATWFKESASNLYKSVKWWTFDVATSYVWDVLEPVSKWWKALTNTIDREQYSNNWLKTLPKNIIAAMWETATSVKNVLNWVPLAAWKIYTKWIQWGVKSLTNATTEHIWWVRKLWHLLNWALMVPATIPKTIEWLSRWLHMPFDAMNKQTTSWKSSDFKLSALK